jgi:hypothetical protein
MKLLEVDAADLAGHATTLRDLFEGRLTGMVIRGAFTPTEAAAVVERLERGDFGLDKQPSNAFKGETYGRVLIVGERDLGPYFSEASRFRDACVPLFAGAPPFQARVESLLGAVGGDYGIAVPKGPDGAVYSPATIRGLHEGGQIDLHCENETVDFPSMWHLSRLIHARNQLSYYVLLARPEAGGELHIHNARFGEESGARMAHMGRTGNAALQALEHFGHAVPYTNAGDMLVFDSGRHFHHVSPVVGQRKRWTMGGFLARSTDDRTVYYWS